MDNSICYLCGLLGALGGADNSNKAFRRWGIPLILTGLSLYYTHSLWSLLLLGYALTLYLGYGLPSPKDPVPSKLGAYFYKWFPYSLKEEDYYTPKVVKKRLLTNLFTRTTIQSLKAIIVEIWAVSVGWWGIVDGFFLTFVGLTVLVAVLINPEGQFRCFGRKLNYSEFMLYLVELYLFTLFLR